MLKFHEIHGEEIPRLAALASEIWHECFPGIITGGQIDYMVEKFQSPAAMTAQLAEGYRYFIVEHEGDDAGYIGVHPEETKMFLSKLYLRKEHRGQRCAGKMLSFVAGLAAASGLESVWLTVNRGNRQAIEVYRNAGFDIVDARKTDIGGGYFMDDYIMELRFD